MKSTRNKILGLLLALLVVFGAPVRSWADELAESNRKNGEGGDPSAPAPKHIASLSLTQQEQAWLHDHPVIRAVQDPGWPPVEFADEEGEAFGISSDYLHLIEERLGIVFERVRNLSWQEAYSRLKRWDIDMTTSVAQTPERSVFWAFTKPYMKIPIVILTRSDVTYISSMRELAGKKIAVVDGYAVTDWIPRDYPDVSLKKVGTVMEGIESLQKGEVFAFVDNMLVIGYYLAKLKIADLKIAGETPYVNAQSMAVRKDWPILADILQKALDSISEEERAEIYMKWVPIRYEHEFDYTLLWQAVAVFVLILAGLLFWNRRLTREIRFRKKAEADLRNSQDRFRRLFDAAPVPLCFVDRNGILVDSNHRFEQTFGYTREDVPTIQHWWRLAYPDLDYRRWVEQTWDASVQRAINDSTDIEPLDYRVTCKNGDIRNVVISGTILGDDFLTAFFDITDRKRAEEEKETYQKQLIQAHKMESIGTLAGGIAHDFNNILQVINGYTQLILMDKDKGHKDFQNLTTIQKAGERAAELVRQLLLFSRKADAERKVLDLNHEVEQAHTILERTIPKMIRIELHLGRGLWPVKADPLQIEQMLLNFGTNAADAMPEGGTLILETANVTLDEAYVLDHIEATAGNYVLLAVSDTGQGMSPDIVAKIFDPFFTTKDIGKGTGLGLASVYGIVKNHGGHILCYSEVDHGTTFKIYLPAMKQRNVQADIPVAEPWIPGGTETLLIVDDEQPIRDFAAQILIQVGYKVLTASSGEEALDIYSSRQQDIDVVVLDIGMPGMGGYRCLQEILKANASAKVIISSGYSASGQIKKALEAGASGYVAKPYQFREMLSKVRAILDGKD